MKDLYVDVTLNNRAYRLKLSPIDMSDAYRALNSQPSRKVEVEGVQFLRLMASLDPDAFAAALFTGLRHQDKTLDTLDKGRKLFSAHLENGGDWEPVAKAIRLAMKKSGALPRGLAEALDREEEEGEAPPAVVESPT